MVCNMIMNSSLFLTDFQVSGQRKYCIFPLNLCIWHISHAYMGFVPLEHAKRGSFGIAESGLFYADAQCQQFQCTESAKCGKRNGFGSVVGWLCLYSI